MSMALWEAGSRSTFTSRTNWRPSEGTTHSGHLHSRFALLRAGQMRYLGGKQDGEVVPVGKVAPGQTVVLSFGHVKLSCDCMVGVSPSLLGVAGVGSPGLLPRGYEGELFVTLQAVKGLALDELEHHVTMGVFT